MAIPEYKNGHFEEMAAWSQILQIVGNSTLIYLSFDTHDSPGTVFIQKWEIFSPYLLVWILFMTNQSLFSLLAFGAIQYSSLSFQELSRKELRPLRQKLSSIRKMKRCGKRIQLHCDPDGNSSITQQEWLACVMKHSGKDTLLFYGKNEYE